jgi:peptidoglycan/xylan/chitin deacetylase (PgdA/CDA1 family)
VLDNTGASVTHRGATKELAARILCTTGVPALARRQMRGRLAILMFHGVEAKPLSPPCQYVIDAATLRRNLEFVRRYFHVLPLEEALARLDAGTLPDRAAALTFDDGTRNLATNAAPVLRDLGLPAAVFLATGKMGTGEALWPDRLWLAFARTTAHDIDLRAVGLATLSLRSAADCVEACEATVRQLTRLPDAERIARVESLLAMLGQESDSDAGPFQMLSWDEARDLASDGRVTLYPHSVTHPILARCTDEKAEYEVSESCATLERETGHAPAIFAYPNGQAQDFDERAKAALRRNGIRWALSTTRGFAHCDSDPLALPRIGIVSTLSLARFQLQVSGAVPLRHLKPWGKTAAARHRAADSR